MCEEQNLAMSDWLLAVGFKTKSQAPSAISRITNSKTNDLKYKEPYWAFHKNIYGEFDPGSGRTLAACLTHASRTV
jgi:hypothetical protein